MDFQLKQVKHETSGGTPSVISQYDYTYRRDGSVATWKVEQGGGAQTWTLGYDVTGQLTSAALWDATPTMLESQTYGYDKAGNRIQVGNGATAPKNYAVNELNQLLTERDHGRTTFAGYVDEPAKVTVNGQPAKVMSTDGGAPFKFEAPVDLDAGVNTVTVQATDGQNNVATKTYEVTTTGDTKKYEYDGNGNLRYEKQPNGTVLREYRWDQQNRLVRVLEGTHESVYEYDGASQRVRIKELESSVETKNETFVWCGSRICHKRASNGSTVVRSYFGNGFEESGTTDYFYTRDHLGSVREVVGADGTTIASRLSYDPWGKITETGSGALSDFTYTGHHYDRSMGLNLARYRAYDPNLGRWLSQDPIGLWGGWNLYGYVGNDPIWYVDPDGRCAVAAAPAVGAWAGAALALWGAWDCAVNGCRGIKALVDIGYQAVIDVTKDKDIPFRGGPPGDTVRGPGTSRKFGEDGFPETDRHLGHPDEKGVGNGDHSHDWERPEDGSDPTHEDKGPPRDPREGDPPPPRGYPPKK